MRADSRAFATVMQREEPTQLSIQLQKGLLGSIIKTLLQIKPLGSQQTLVIGVVLTIFQGKKRDLESDHRNTKAFPHINTGHVHKQMLQATSLASRWKKHHYNVESLPLMHPFRRQFCAHVLNFTAYDKRTT
jgi:hypothetical protein